MTAKYYRQVNNKHVDFTEEEIKAEDVIAAAKFPAAEEELEPVANNTSVPNNVPFILEAEPEYARYVFIVPSVLVSVIELDHSGTPVKVIEEEA